MEIYKITNTVTNKSYIGKTTIGYLNRFHKHVLNAEKGINRRLYDSMRFHGMHNFTVTLEYTATTVEELNIKEIELISKFNTLMPNGYNMTLGGDGGYTLANWTDEKRKELYKQQALKRTGRKCSKETKEKISKTQKGKNIPKEVREKISKALLTHFDNLSEDEKKEKASHLRTYDGFRKGSKHSENTKKLMSQSKKGKTYEEIYSNDVAKIKREMSRKRFTERNPKAFSLTEYQKEYILKAVNNEETVAMIVEKLQISPFKIRQFLLLKGINNFQKYKGNKKWKIKHEKWSLLEK